MTDLNERDVTHLYKVDWMIGNIDQPTALEMVKRYHYAKGGSNTAVFRHGLFYRGLGECLGVAWWLPPTQPAAAATWPNWRAVLSLHRLVVHPDVPTNGASFLISQSIKLVRKDERWECLVTYADTSENHTGAIYRATNWEYCGLTPKYTQWYDPKTGLRVAAKATNNRTKAEMEGRGYEILGRFAKHKYRMVL